MSLIRIPPVLRDAVGGESRIVAEGDNVRELLDDLISRFPALRPQLVEDDDLAPFVNVYVEGEDVRTLDGLDTPVSDTSTVILLPAMAGGSPTPLAGSASRPAEPASGAASRRSRRAALRVCAARTIPSGITPRATRQERGSSV